MTDTVYMTETVPLNIDKIQRQNWEEFKYSVKMIIPVPVI